jgi:hypothetical protein
MVVTLSVYRYENPAPASGFPRLPAFENSNARRSELFGEKSGQEARSGTLKRLTRASTRTVHYAAIMDDRKNKHTVV